MNPILKEIIDHTLKKKMSDGTREWSRTSLTMFTAFSWCMVSASIDLFYRVIHFEVWISILAVATGVKAVDAAYTKIRHIKDKDSPPL